jgi:hypothetical protein
LEAEPLKELKRWLSYYERYWENKLNALKRFVESDDEDGGNPFAALGLVDRAPTKQD